MWWQLYARRPTCDRLARLCWIAGSTACYVLRMTKSGADLDDLIDLRAEISELEHKTRRARMATGTFKFVALSAPLALASMIIVNVWLEKYLDLRVFWTVVGIYVGVSALLMIALGVWHDAAEKEILSPRRLELDLERLYDEQALLFSGAEIDLTVRRYAFRSSMQRSAVQTRRRGNAYRRVNNLFQSIIIVGSLATTTVASLNPDQGPLKWVAVGLSFSVGLAAGFTGFFKYRERAFYLRQTADDLEEQLNAYELGLPPYRDGDEEERVALLTARMEAIRVAQQQREQQLDQPKGAKEE